MKDWTYADRGGLTYEIAPDKEFEFKAGKSNIRIYPGSCLNKEVEGWNGDFVFSDPPWETGNMNSFRTKAEMSKGDDAMFWGIIERVLKASKSAKYGYVVETGVRNIEKISKMFNGIVVEGRYYKKLKMYYITNIKEIADKLLYVDDIVAPGIALDYAKSKNENCIIFDPCMGTGLTMETSIKKGLSFQGCEINTRRLSVGMTRVDNLGFSCGLNKK